MVDSTKQFNSINDIFSKINEMIQLNKNLVHITKTFSEYNEINKK